MLDGCLTTKLNDKRSQSGLKFVYDIKGNAMTIWIKLLLEMKVVSIISLLKRCGASVNGVMLALHLLKVQQVPSAEKLMLKMLVYLATKVYGIREYISRVTPINYEV